MTNITNSSVTLHGTRKQFTIPLKEFNLHTKFKLTSHTPINNTQIVNQAHQIQNTQLKNQQQELKNQNNTIEDIKNVDIGFTISGVMLVGTGIMLGAVGITITFFDGDPEGAVFLKVAVALLALGIVLIVIANVLRNIHTRESKMILSEWNVVRGNLNDLNSYQHSCPVAKDINLTIKRDDVLIAGLNASDDEEGALNYNVVTEPEHGTLELKTNGTFSYIPTEDYMGDDSFTYKANNGFSDSNIANVTIKITPPTPPIANNMNLTTTIGKGLNTTFNITNPYNNPLIFSIIKPPMHGTVKIGQGSFIYIPTKNYAGIDSFTYKVNNGLDSNIAKITINIKINKNRNVFS